MPLSLEQLRRYAIARSLFKPTTLGRALRRLGFVQADPIRAPARAQDLTLRPRVAGYRAGDLERRYPHLPIEEDYFINYGYLHRDHHQLMHPRTPAAAWSRGPRDSSAGAPCLHPRAGHRSPARRRPPLCARQDHQLVRRRDQCDHPPAR